MTDSSKPSRRAASRVKSTGTSKRGSANGNRPTRRSILHRQRTPAEQLRRDAPAGLGGLAVSVLFHLLLLGVLALLVVSIERPPTIPPMEIGWLTPEELQPSESEPAPAVELQSFQLSSAPPQPKANPSQQAVDRTATDDPPRVQPVRASQLLADRESKGGIEGTHPQVIRAIEQSLAWLAGVQQSDGRWQLHDGYPDAAVSIETDTGATSLALLAFLGAGQTHQQGAYSEVVAAGLKWLQDIQRPNGDLFDIYEQGANATFYAHSQGTIVLCEALAMTGDESLREPAQRAVDYLIDAQNPEQGGWRYRPLNAQGIGDLSVTGWALMALHSARIAQLEVPEQTWFLAGQFLDSVQESPASSAYYKYQPQFPADPSQRLSMTAEGLLCRQWLGWFRDYPPLQTGVTFLLQRDNRPAWEAGKRNVYAWYYAAQTLHNVGGGNWHAWYDHTQQLIVDNQDDRGSTRGSWHPTRPDGAFHEYAAQAGRLYFTVMCSLILETPFRHRSVYDASVE